MTIHQKWLPHKYQKNAHFVAELGAPLIDLLNPQKKECILDLGCGDGTLMVKLAHLGCQVIGIDGSPEMIDACQKKRIDSLCHGW